MFAREGTKAEGAAVQDYLGRQASARGGGGEDRVWGRSAGEEEAASGKGEGDEMARARARARARAPWEGWAQPPSISFSSRHRRGRRRATSQ